ncbi:unnamed protein product [Schistocephalus solidus]|uniref:Secreted protein n=1 Tax=Schistocephalus solidus TaxID=70667 RepID=A0A183SH43_SCHSO|nr:unnamed protein product [Schistocephalus solidus]
MAVCSSPIAAVPIWPILFKSDSHDRADDSARSRIWNFASAATGCALFWQSTFPTPSAIVLYRINWRSTSLLRNRA